MNRIIRWKLLAFLCGICAAVSAASPAYAVSAREMITIERLGDPQPVQLYGAAEAEGIAEYPETDPEADLSLLAAISPEARTVDGSYLSLGEISDMGDGVVIFSYQLSETLIPNDYAFEGDWDWGSVRSGYVSYDLTTGKILGEIPARNNQDGWYEQTADGFLYAHYRENCRDLTWYDKMLREQGSLTLNDSEMTDLFSAGMKTWYYTDNARQAARLMLLEDGPRMESVDIRPFFSVRRMDGWFRAEDGTEYLIVNGWNGEFQESRGILNVNTGEFVRMDPVDKEYCYARYNALIFPVYSWDSPGISGYRITVDGERAFSYIWPAEDQPELYVLSDGRLFFVRQVWTHWEEDMPEEDYRLLHVDAWLADGRTGQITGSLHLPVPEGTSYINLGSPAVIPGTDAILLRMDSRERGTEFYTWLPSLSQETSTEPQITPFAWKQAEALDLPTSWDPESFVPGPVPEELSDLARRAAELGEQYGMHIMISEECRNLYGGYAISPENDPENIQAALDLLEEELAKYPQGFFRNLWELSGISAELWLSGAMNGIEMETLDSAGGFANTSGDRAVIVANIQMPESLRTTLHHELSHIIDGQIIWNSDGLLSDESWISLNPSTDEHEDLYTYTYTQNGYEDGVPYCYYGCRDYEDVYFIDDYSMTFPTEDRARLFESIMTEGTDSWISWEECPHLREKLNAYALAIREVLGEDDWENVIWEKYLQ